MHTLTDAGVGHLCVCVCEQVPWFWFATMILVIIIWVRLLCACVCAVCMHVCVHGRDETDRRGRWEHEELHYAQLEIADCNVPQWQVTVLQT